MEVVATEFAFRVMADVVGDCLAPLDIVPEAGFGRFKATDAIPTAAPTAPATPAPAGGVGVGGALEALLVLLALRSEVLARDEDLASGNKIWVCGFCVGGTIAVADGTEAAALFDTVVFEVGRPDLRA